MQKSPEPKNHEGLWTAAILIVVIAVLYLAREILVPLAFAFVLTFIFAPIVDRLQKLHLSRAPAIFLVITVFIALTGGMGWVIFSQMVEVVNELPRYKLTIRNKVQAMRSPTKGSLAAAAASVKEIGNELSAPQADPNQKASPKNRVNTQSTRPLPVQVVGEESNGFQYAYELAKPVLAPLTTLGMVLVFCVFLLIEQSDLRNRMLSLAGLDQLTLITEALSDATHRVGRYLMMQFLVNAAFALVCGTALYFIGVPYALLWGSIAGIFRIVPYVGSAVAAALPILLSVAVFDSWMPLFQVVLLFGALETITGYFVEPWLYGTNMGISSLALLLAALFWTVLWGPAGLILSTPLTVCVVVLGHHVPNLSFLHVLLGDQPALSKEAQLYQRLLAMDDIEARTVADEFLKDHTLIEFGDLIVVPVLAMAGQDSRKGTLNGDLEEYVLLSMRDLVDELQQYAPTDSPEASSSNGRIVCIASNEAGVTASILLTQLPRKFCSLISTIPLDPQYPHLAHIAEPSPMDTFLISIVPPFSFARVRNLSKVLRARYPHNKIIFGIWGFKGDSKRLLLSFQPDQRDILVTSFEGALKQFTALSEQAKVTLTLPGTPKSI